MPIRAEQIRLDPQRGCISPPEMFNYIIVNAALDTYMLVLVCVFHSTQGVMQRVQVWSRDASKGRRLFPQLANPACATLS